MKVKGLNIKITCFHKFNRDGHLQGSLAEACTAIILTTPIPIDVNKKFNVIYIRNCECQTLPVALLIGFEFI